MLEKNKFEYSPLGMSLSKSFKKDKARNIAKSIAKSESDFNYDAIISFTNFTTGMMNLKRCH